MSETSMRSAEADGRKGAGACSDSCKWFCSCFSLLVGGCKGWGVGGGGEKNNGIMSRGEVHFDSSLGFVPTTRNEGALMDGSEWQAEGVTAGGAGCRRCKGANK